MSTLRTAVQRRNVDLNHLIQVSQVAALHGLRVLPDSRLTNTPYRAMNPCAGREKHQPYIEGALTYRPDFYTGDTANWLPMDMNHELEEYLKMCAGWHYHAAHLWANRKQRTFVVLHLSFRIRSKKSRKARSGYGQAQVSVLR